MGRYISHKKRENKLKRTGNFDHFSNHARRLIIDEGIMPDVTLMEKLKFRRDSTYKYDKNAISVMTSNEEIIGYLPPHITKVLTPINDRDLDFDNTIIRLEKDHADQKYSVQVAIYLPEKLIPSVSQQPEFIIDKGSRGDLYILLNCSSDVCDNIINQYVTISSINWNKKILIM